MTNLSLSRSASSPVCRAWRLACLTVPLLVAGAASLEAQRGWRSRGPLPDKDPNFKEFNASYDGRLTFTRFRYTPSQLGWGGGGGFFGGVNYSWDHDYPRSDHHIMVIMRELTATSVRDDSSNILSVNDAELFKYPVVYLCEPGFWTVTEREAELVRSYLLKGGFMIIDDFAGPWALENLQSVLSRVLPGSQLQPLDASDPIFHTFFDIDSLNFQHPYYDVQAEFLGLFEDNDPKKRLLAIVNYDYDVSESWEWSGTGFIPIDLSNTAFKLGVNYFMYAMTH
jgi:hypothetical protein